MRKGIASALRCVGTDSISLALLAIGVVLLATTCVATLDAWSDLALGRWMLQHGALPAADPFLFTDGGTTVANSWLARLLFAALHRVGGFPLLVVVKDALLVAAFSFAFVTARRIAKRPSPWILAILLWGACLASVRFQMRSEIFGLLCFAVVLDRLVRGWLLGRTAWEIIPLVLLWSNLHASYPLGWALVGIALAGAAFDRFLLRRPPDGPPMRALVLLLFATIAIAAVHPDGLSRLAHPFLQQTEWIFTHTVHEWMPLFSDAFGTPLLRLASVVLLAAGLVVTAAIAQARSTAPLFAVALFAWLLLTSGRHLAFFALLVAPLTAGGLVHLLSRIALRPRGRRTMTVIASSLTALLLLAIGSGAVRTSWGPVRIAGLGAEESHLPERAADFLQSLPTDGRIFNSYDIGGYLSWRLAPDRRLAIDGRNMVYGPEHYRRYLDVTRRPHHAWERFAAEQDISIVVLATTAADSRALLGLLAQHPDWAPIWVDHRAAIFLRRDEANAALIAAHEMPLSADAALAHLEEAMRHDPAALCTLGDTLFALGEHGEAKSLYEQAREADPATCPRAFSLALMAKRNGNDTRFHELLRTAGREDPRNGFIAFEQGMAAERAGDPFAALRHYRRALERGLRHPSAFNNLGRLYLERQQWSQAKPLLEEALAIDPNHAGALRNLGIYHRRVGSPAVAIRLWLRYLEREPEAPGAETIRREIAELAGGETHAH